MTSRIKGTIFILSALYFLVSCVPTIVIVDRASVIEEESAGDWPEIERALGLLEAHLQPDVDLLEKDPPSQALKILPMGSASNASQKGHSDEEKTHAEEVKP